MSFKSPITIKNVAERSMFTIRLPSEPTAETKHWSQN